MASLRRRWGISCDTGSGSCEGCPVWNEARLVDANEAGTIRAAGACAIGLRRRAENSRKGEVGKRPGAPLLLRGPASSRSCRCIRGVVLRLRTPPDARELAFHLALTPSTLSRRFCALYGELPGAYMKRRQLAIAILLLQTTTLGTATIAARSGFGSRETLFRTFRRLLRATPSSYRMEINVTSHRHRRRGRLRRPFP